MLAPLTLVSRPEVAQLERDVAQESPRPFFFFLSVEDSSWRPRWQQLAGGGTSSARQLGDELSLASSNATGPLAAEPLELRSIGCALDPTLRVKPVRRDADLPRLPSRARRAGLRRC